MANERRSIMVYRGRRSIAWKEVYEVYYHMYAYMWGIYETGINTSYNGYFLSIKEY